MTIFNLSKVIEEINNASRIQSVNIVGDARFRPGECKGIGRVGRHTQVRGRASEAVHQIVGVDPIGDNAL
jgi:hypothetical protein